jgi:prophage regulatory protein
MRCLRRKDVLNKIGLPNSNLYKMIGEGLFPKPIKIGKASIWVEEEVDVVLRAYVAGMDEQKIKALVLKLEHERSLFNIFETPLGSVFKTPKVVSPGL